VAKKYLEVMEKNPPDETISKTIVPAAVTSTKDGLQTLTIDEVESPKVGDAINRDTRIMAEFRNEGFKYEIKTWAKVEEALESIGLGG
jgi:hypothetical protein